MSYADADEITLATNLGYEVSCDQRNGHRFLRGDRHVWAVRDGWQTADLSEDNFFINHKSFTDLSEALGRDLDIKKILHDQLN